MPVETTTTPVETTTTPPETTTAETTTTPAETTTPAATTTERAETTATLGILCYGHCRLSDISVQTAIGLTDVKSSYSVNKQRNLVPREIPKM